MRLWSLISPWPCEDINVEIVISRLPWIFLTIWPDDEKNGAIVLRNLTSLQVGEKFSRFWHTVYKDDCGKIYVKTKSRWSLRMLAAKITCKRSPHVSEMMAKKVTCKRSPNGLSDNDGGQKITWKRSSNSLWGWWPKNYSRQNDVAMFEDGGQNITGKGGSYRSKKMCYISRRKLEF